MAATGMSHKKPHTELWIAVDEEDPMIMGFHIMDHQHRVATGTYGNGSNQDPRLKEIVYWSCFTESPMHVKLPPRAGEVLLSFLSHFAIGMTTTALLPSILISSIRAHTKEGFYIML